MRLILRRGLVATRNTRKPNSFMHSVSARFIIGRRFRVSRKHSLSLSLSLSNSRQRRDNENRDRLGKIKMRKKEGKKERKKGREKKNSYPRQNSSFPPRFRIDAVQRRFSSRSCVSMFSAQIHDSPRM